MTLSTDLVAASYFIYDDTSSETITKTSNVTLVREDPSSEENFNFFAHSTNDETKTPLPATPIGGGTSVTSLKKENNIYFSYNNAYVDHALKVTSNDVKLNELYVAYAKNQNDSSYKGVDVYVKTDQQYTGVYGISSDIDISGISSTVTNDGEINFKMNGFFIKVNNLNAYVDGNSSLTINNRKVSLESNFLVSEAISGISSQAFEKGISSVTNEEGVNFTLKDSFVYQLIGLYSNAGLYGSDETAQSTITNQDLILNIISSSSVNFLRGAHALADGNGKSTIINNGAVKLDLYAQTKTLIGETAKSYENASSTIVNNDVVLLTLSPCYDRATSIVGAMAESSDRASSKIIFNKGLSVQVYDMYDAELTKLYGVVASSDTNALSTIISKGGIEVVALDVFISQKTPQTISSSNAYFDITGDVTLFVKNLHVLADMEKSNLVAVSGSFATRTEGSTTYNSQINGDIKVTFIADQPDLYSGGFGSNIYGAHVTKGTLEHNGNVNVSLGGAAQNLNLKDSSIYGSFADTGATYTKRDRDVRTLYFGATDEEDKNVSYTSSVANQFKASFANFDKVVVRENSSLYIDDGVNGQIADYFQEGAATAHISGTAAESNSMCNGAIMSYGGKIKMPAKTSLVLQQNAKMDVVNLESTGANIYLDNNAKLNIHNTLINTDKVTTVTINSAKDDQLMINKMANVNSGSLAINLTKNAANTLSGFNAFSTVDAVKDVVKIKNGNKGYQLNIAEGDILGQISATIANDGAIQNVKEAKNNTVISLTELGFNGFQVFRSQMNDLDKRMGDLRTMPTASGAWARTIAGQSQYKSTHNTYKTLQVGVDHRMGNFFGGVMASYTDSDGTVKMGDSDDTNYSFGLYGGYLADNGMFVDVTVKRHHLESDYDLRYQSGDRAKGSYHTSGTLVSLETGWRLPISNTNFYVEPQVEFMYGHVDSVSYTTSNGVKVN